MCERNRRFPFRALIAGLILALAPLSARSTTEDRPHRSSTPDRNAM